MIENFVNNFISSVSGFVLAVLVVALIIETFYYLANTRYNYEPDVAKRLIKFAICQSPILLAWLFVRGIISDDMVLVTQLLYRVVAFGYSIIVTQWLTRNRW